MKKFEYEITKHPNEAFTQVVYFCSGEGECSVDHVPGDQISILENLLNDRGAEGWDLVQLVFGTDGILCFWKKAI